jgi:hypothetical protein
MRTTSVRCFQTAAVPILVLVLAGASRSASHPKPDLVSSTRAPSAVTQSTSHSGESEHDTRMPPRRVARSHTSRRPEQFSSLTVPGGLGTGTWVEAGRQNASGIWTRLQVHLEVPNTPFTNNPPSTSSWNKIFIWAGIEDSFGELLLQPVLQWNQNGHSWWEMQDYVIGPDPNNPILDKDTPQPVSAGDNILIEIVATNPSSCTPQQCQYSIFWQDLTSWVFGGLQWTATNTYLDVADGAVLELGGQFVDCRDLPGTSPTWGGFGAFFQDLYLVDSVQAQPINLNLNQYGSPGYGPVFDTKGTDLGYCGFSVGNWVWAGHSYTYVAY